MGPNNPSSASFDALKAKVDAVRERHTEAKSLFRDFEFDPTKTADYRKFMEDHLNELTMAYVVGVRDAENPNKGFVTGGEATDDADARFKASPAVAAALAAGLNLDNDDED